MSSSNLAKEIAWFKKVKKKEIAHQLKKNTQVSFQVDGRLFF